MSGFKKSQPGLAFSGEKITPDEIDAYSQYIIAFPAAASGLADTWVGTGGTSGTSDVVAVVLSNVINPYPCNVRFSLLGSHDQIVGTLKLNGKDQFGNVISESLTFAKGTLGGTAVGTKVFAQFTSGTVYYGTFAGNGTPKIGLGTAGTTTLFGLPQKLGGTTDVKLIGQATGTGIVTTNGGTIAAYVDVPNSAIKLPKDLAGTMIISVLYRSTYDATALASVAGLDQRT